MADETLHDLLSKEYFLMTRLGQPFASIEAMPAYEADLFVDMQLEAEKEKREAENA